jgi:hypothetical protein
LNSNIAIRFASVLDTSTTNRKNNRTAKELLLHGLLALKTETI